MAGVDVGLYAKAALITAILFFSIYWINLIFSEKREEAVKERMNDIVEELEELESTYYLTEYLATVEEGNDTCRSLVYLLNQSESKLWNLDVRIRTYRDIVKEVESDEFYITEKKKLNRREVLRLSMLERVMNRCGFNQTVVLYFYGKCEGDKKCDEQGYVLSYTKDEIPTEIAVFSFDADRGVKSVDYLMEAYNVTDLPCIVVNGRTQCGLHDRYETKKILCTYSPHISFCG